MTSLVTVLRRFAVVLVAAGVLAAVAAPAGADTPEGWPAEPDVDGLHALFVLGAIPLGLCLLLAALVYLPAMARGERVAPGAPEVENQWLGGPRKEPHELTAPEAEDSHTGGASARW
ncbi:hypothetical protein [Nocardioides ferulae]|uniref:hypothetical protein n=1 Tax=Nocardioides ferulae TaxID=2340821 RepID=UPI0013DDB066|nr:hypothetical protein [Nocardioides ferulae]